MKKLLIVVFPFSRFSGFFFRLILTARHFRHRYEITLLLHTSESDAIKDLEAEGLRIINSKALSRTGRFTVLPGIISIARAAREVSPDAIISLGVWADFLVSCFNLGRYIFLKKSIPHIIHYIASPLTFVTRAGIRVLFHIMAIISTREADEIIFISKPDATLYGRLLHIDSQKVSVIPIGVDVTGASDKTQLHTPLRFGVACRFTAEKNVDIIIKSAIKAREGSKSPFDLELYGDGPEDNDLRKTVAKLNANDYIRFNGWNSSPSQLFKGIDCLLMYSVTEGTPRAILDAALRGVPAISRDVGGVSDIIIDGQTGFLVHSQEELRARILYFIENPQKILEFGAAARAYVISRHAIENETAQISRLIEKISRVTSHLSSG